MLLQAAHTVGDIGRWAFGRQTVLSEFVLPPVGPRFRVFAVVLGASTLALLMATQAAGWHQSPHLQAMPSGFPLVAAVAIFISLSFAFMGAGRETNTFYDHTSILTMSMVAAFGPDPVLVAAMGVATFLANLKVLPMSGGPWGAVSNGVGMTLEGLVPGLLYVALLPVFVDAVVHPLVVVGLVLVPLTVMVNAAIVIVTTRLEGGEVAGELVREACKETTYYVPFTMAGAAACMLQPWLGVVALFGPTLFAHFAEKAEEQLVLARRRLEFDEMTGLHTKAEGMRRLELWMEEVASGKRRSVAAMMLDIDNFKILNDTHGHVEGDEALKAVAAAIATSIRSGDVAARYGGEEFTMLLVDTPVEAVLGIAERVREQCFQALLPWGTSVSIGVSLGQPEDIERDELIGRADAALYRAKNTGKNRVVFISEDAGSADVVGLRRAA